MMLHGMQFTRRNNLGNALKAGAESILQSEIKFLIKSVDKRL